MIDNVIERQTPEGVALVFMPAGLLPRMGAWCLDFAIRLLILGVIGIILGVLGEVGEGLMLIIYFLLDWFYAVVFEVFWRGQTIGKRKFGIRVCQDDGTPIRWQASMIRNLLRVADFLPFLFFSGIISMLFHPASKRLGDIVAGTLVVYNDAVQGSYDIPTQSPIRLPIPLQLDEQQAILAFAERSDSLPVARGEELAEILRPVAVTSVQKNVLLNMREQIVGYANTLIGR